MGQAVTDMGAIISAPLFVIGEKLGLYKAMAGAGPLTSRGARRAHRRRRALGARVAAQPGGRRLRRATTPRPTATRCPTSRRWRSPTRTARSTSSASYDSIASLYADEDRILEAFRTGEGMGWHEHDHRLFRGTERFFRPGYRGPPGRRVDPGARRRRRRSSSAGAKVADVGCGHGASTIIMAEAFPNSEFFGFDYHDASIEQAREARRGGRRRRPDHVRGRLGARTTPGERLRPGLRVRLPARHGRPGRRRRARPRDARARRHLDDRRAVRRTTASRTTSTRSGASSTAPRR